MHRISEAALRKKKSPLQRICIARDEIIRGTTLVPGKLPGTHFLLNAQVRSALPDNFLQANSSGGKVRFYLNRKALAADDAFSLPEGKTLKTPSTPFSYAPYSSGIFFRCQAKL